MEEISILIGGKAGDGIKQMGNMIARMLNYYGLHVFVYEDYQSLIKGGHNFSVIRAGIDRIDSHRDDADVLIAFDQNTLEEHRGVIKKDALVIFDSGVCKLKKGIGVNMSLIAKENGLPSIARNAIGLGILAKILGIDFENISRVIEMCLKDHAESNIKAAKKGYEAAENRIVLKHGKLKPKTLLTGNEAIGLGAVKAGLDFYISYPMTPSTGILHFLAENQKQLGIHVIHPENEISAAMMAQGVAYAGKKVAVGTAGGGFALMTEALSFAGIGEIPVMFVLSQRYSPGTGVPTYTGQSDLMFALNSGHGEFSRIVAAPGDADQAFYLSAELMNLSWKFQIPSILLSDKHLSESTFVCSFNEKKIKEEFPKMWDRKGKYARYRVTGNGISPLIFPGSKDAVVKATSYEHDDLGIAVEDMHWIQKMADKRLRKRETIKKYFEKKETVKVFGNPKSKFAIIGWGSVLGAARETAEELGIRFIQPIYFKPFNSLNVANALKGVKKLIDVEMNSTGQLEKILLANGIKTNNHILKYDGRPFAQDELRDKILKIIK